jgi:hypothetical protein
MQNTKIQLWALGIAEYDCNIEYIAGKENMCADLLSRPQPRPEEMNKPHTDDNNLEPDINNNAFEISTINSNKFNSKLCLNLRNLSKKESTTK